MSIHGGLVLGIFFGIAYAVSFTLSQLGVLSYGLAYFLAFYLPTFLSILIRNSAESEAEFTESTAFRGVMAIILLAIAHGSIFVAASLGIRDEDGLPVNSRTMMFLGLLPIFLGLEFAILFSKIKSEMDYAKRDANVT